MKRRLLLVLILVLAAAAWTVNELHRPFRGYSGNLILVLEPGASAVQTAQLLADRGVIAYRGPFLIRYVFGRPDTLKAGEYLFDRPLRPLDVYRKLVRGEVYLHSVTIPEGSDRFDMARILHNRLGIDPQDFLRASGNGDAIRDLDPQARTLEGYLFPETYFFPRGVSAETVLGTMLGQFRTVLRTRIPPELQPPPEKMRDVITLASLVEKETPMAEERPLIAGVFAKRLKKRMPLQCDPTVVYAARLEGRPSGPILKSDLKFDSSYNTYRHAGLPPGPIASPGEASIFAALQPEPTEYLYFVSNNQGGHFFSKTLAEHQRRVARYRREVAVRRAASGRGAETISGSGRREKNFMNSSSEGAEEPQQEEAHPRSLSGDGARARRGRSNTPHSGGPPEAPRP
jgi:UPF0755 protein